MNIHSLLSDNKARFSIAFDRIYHRNICVSSPGVVEVTPFMSSVQNRLYGNHLMTEIAEPDYLFTGKRTIDVGECTFTVAQLYCEVPGKIFQLKDQCGYLQMKMKKNGNRDLLSRIMMYHNWLPISRDQLTVELMAMERRYAWTKKVAITDRRKKSRIEKCYYEKVD